MAQALREHGYSVVAIDIKNGHDFFDCRLPTFRSVITNPPYGDQGRMAAKFVERALELTRKRRGIVAMLLKVDFDSGKTRRRFFDDCPAWATKVVLTKRVMWFESRTGNSSSDNHAWFLWDWRHSGPPTIAYAPDREWLKLEKLVHFWRREIKQGRKLKIED